MTNLNALEKIVVALDGSDTAKNAADIALQIAKAETQLIEGVYIVDEPMILDPYADYAKELGSDRESASTKQRIEWFKELGYLILDQFQAKCDSQGIPVKTEVLLGGIPKLILREANHASFLALGRRGNSHASVTDHLGVNFRDIAHHANIPLIVGGDNNKLIKQLFLVYDGSQKADLAMKLALSLEVTLSASAIVGLTGHMYLEDNPNLQRDRLSAGGVGKGNIVDLRSKPIHKILDVIANTQTDLIIMGGYSFPEFLDWLEGSPNDQILRQSDLPAVIA